MRIEALEWWYRDMSSAIKQRMSVGLFGAWPAESEERNMDPRPGSPFNPSY